MGQKPQQVQIPPLHFCGGIRKPYVATSQVLEFPDYNGPQVSESTALCLRIAPSHFDTRVTNWQQPVLEWEDDDGPVPETANVTGTEAVDARERKSTETS